jgi:hypothetical protein
MSGMVGADHVIAATGYRTGLTRLAFLSEAIRSRLRTVGGCPAVERGYESSVAGLTLGRRCTQLRASHALRVRYLARRACGGPPTGGILSLARSQSAERQVSNG